MTAREKEKALRMELALGEINDKLFEMSELADIGHALIEAATMPSEDALRTIARALAHRVYALADIRDEIGEEVLRGLKEPEPEGESEGGGGGRCGS